MITACSLLPDLAPLAYDVELVGPGEVRVHCSLANGERVTYTGLQYSERDGWEGDAPNEVLEHLDRKFDCSDSFDDSYEFDDRPTCASERHYEGGAL